MQQLMLTLKMKTGSRDYHGYLLHPGDDGDYVQPGYG